MKNIKVLFVDIDDTLFDFDVIVAHALKDGMEKFHLGTYEDWMLTSFTEINTVLWRQIEKGELDIQGLRKIRFGKVFDSFGIKNVDGPAFEEFFRQYVHEHVDRVPGADEFMHSLAKDYVIGVASNGPYEQQVHRIHLAHMEDAVSHYFISERLGASKPSAVFFQKALEELPGVLPSECVMIGDSQTSDIQGGINAGMHTVFFNIHHKKDLSYVTAERCFDSLKEIEDYIRSLG